MISKRISRGGTTAVYIGQITLSCNLIIYYYCELSEAAQADLAAMVTKNQRRNNVALALF